MCIRDSVTAVQFNGALCMHCTRGCFTADISTELRADFQMENEILQCRFVISESLAKMVRHWTTDQRAWIVARKNRGDTLAEIQACFIQFMCMCVNNHCRLTMPTFGPATLGMC